MVCRDWQRRIPDFLDDQMPVSELEKFIDHVKDCGDCHEELEIMFILSVGLKELEHDTGMSYNFKHMLEDKLKRARYQCERHKSFQKVKRLILGGMYFVTLAGMAFQILKWI